MRGRGDRAMREKTNVEGFSKPNSGKFLEGLVIIYLDELSLQ